MSEKIRTWFVTNEFWPKANEQHYAFKFKPPESQYGKTFEVVMKSDYDLLMKDVEGLIEVLEKYANKNAEIIKKDKLDEWLKDSRANPDNFISGTLYVFGLTNNLAREALTAWQSKYGDGK